MNRCENFAASLLGLILLAEIGVVRAAGEQPKAAAPATSAPSPAAAPAAAAPPAATAPAAAGAPAAAPAASGETGLAAVYNHKLNGRKTASGERYDMNKLTAAHKTLPFGTMVKVTNAKSQKSVTVRINDRGPTQAGRILDISTAAAKQLGISPTGMAQVTAEVAAK
jgi:rare lipoprotein A